MIVSTKSGSLTFTFEGVNDATWWKGVAASFKFYNDLEVMRALATRGAWSTTLGFTVEEREFPLLPVITDGVRKWEFVPGEGKILGDMCEKGEVIFSPVS